MALKTLNIENISHVSTNTSLKYVTLHAEVEGKTVLISLHPAVLFAASQQAMASFQYILECEMNGVDPTIEDDGNETEG